ncbi:MAG: hypothetical protein H7A24_06750 [Leptospiraceae bacterium]|nr:hypothetical protein [Leptospiraceae bacterium]MCP5511561.1 hypothetical protein [Leptospiraceae bacterium]
MMIASLLFNCNDSTLFYSSGESNLEIFKAFAAKDATCGSVHNLTGFIPGKSKKEDVDNCVKAIYAKNCSEWNSVSDPTPYSCLGINYTTK